MSRDVDLLKADVDLIAMIVRQCGAALPNDPSVDEQVEIEAREAHCGEPA